MATSSRPYNPPCAACRYLRRKCLPAGCVFAPYFPPEDDPQRFINVHRIFGASHVAKLLNSLSPHQRGDAVRSLAYEAGARVRDPVHGCVGAISFLQEQVNRLQKELDHANADLIQFASTDTAAQAAEVAVELDRRSFGNDIGGGNNVGGMFNDQTTPNSYSFPSPYYNNPWSDNYGGMA